MLGIFRTSLALFVVAQHVIGIPVIVHYAVHGFFILSGYLMTYIMHKTYHYKLSGITAFICNRFLRLFPVYWFALVVTICILIYFGTESRFHEAISIPDSRTEWLQNIFMVFLNIFPGDELPRVLPATWALTVELLFYFLIALGFSKNKKLTLIWVFISLAYIFYTFIFNLDYKYRYNAIFAGSLPFSLGALLFYYKESLLTYLNKGLPIILFLYFLNIILSILVRNHSFFYIFASFNYLLSFILIGALLSYKPNINLKKFDAKVGDYSYPIYLFHWTACYLVVTTLNLISLDDLTRLERVAAFLGTLLISIVFSKISNVTIDNNVQKVRLKVKERLSNAV